MTEQTTIPREKSWWPDPSGRQCEWCEESAVRMVQILHTKQRRPSGQFLPTCRGHEDLALRTADPHGGSMD